MRVRGHHLSHDPAIEAAALEYAAGRMRTVGPALAIEVMFRAAANPKHPKQLRAAEMIANRVGLHETTEHVVNVNHSDRTGAALLERIRTVAATLGMDTGALLGVNAAPRQIEGEVTTPAEHAASFGVGPGMRAVRELRAEQEAERKTIEGEVAE